VLYGLDGILSFHIANQAIENAFISVSLNTSGQNHHYSKNTRNYFFAGFLCIASAKKYTE